MTAPTPGPWTAEPAHSIQNGARIPTIGAILDLDCSQPGLSMANATLAAAAPDMLAALRGALAMLSQPVFSGENRRTGPAAIMASDADLARKMIKAAIDKAEGKP